MMKARPVRAISIGTKIGAARIAIALFVWNVPAAHAYDTDDPYALFSLEARAVAESTEAQSCDEDWQLFWTLLRDGEPVAGSHLTWLMLWNGLVPPGSSVDRISLLRHLRILMAYAVPSNDPWAVEFIAGDAEFYGIEFSSCVAHGWRTKQECLDRAIANGVIPPIETYDREISTLSEARKLPARCLAEALLSEMALVYRGHPDNAFIPHRPPSPRLWHFPRDRGF